MLHVRHDYYKLEKCSLPFLRHEGIMCTSLVICLCGEGVLEQCVINYFQSKKEHILKNKFEKYVQKHVESTVC